MKLKIHVIGGYGKVGGALLRGLLINQAKLIDLSVSGPQTKELNKLREQYKVKVSTNNLEYALGADFIILAVKPDKVPKVLRELAGGLANKRTDKIILCTAAAVNLIELEKLLQDKAPVVRIMPNLGIAVGQGLIAWYGNGLNKANSQKVDRFLKQFGVAVKVGSDDDIERFTINTGTGLAIDASYLQARIDAGVYSGLSRKLSELAAVQTMQGLLALMREGLYPDFSTVINAVETPAGTTVEATLVLKERSFTATIIKAIDAGVQKIRAIHERVAQVWK